MKNTTRISSTPRPIGVAAALYPQPLTSPDKSVLSGSSGRLSAQQYNYHLLVIHLVRVVSNHTAVQHSVVHEMLAALMTRLVHIPQIGFLAGGCSLRQRFCKPRLSVTGVRYTRRIEQSPALHSTAQHCTTLYALHWVCVCTLMWMWIHMQC